MTRKRNQHVVPTKDGWAVKPAGSPKATKVFDTQRDGHIWPGSLPAAAVKRSADE
ncbi:DUF2188 domain-containing protein [Candidatus Palauibacter sp.]|uniref:DUF2188 domain-containing protein n=1 Tax=Candidatus Palauibacter sp. TaxID=3101350 RepID=UPI003B51EE4F